MAIVFVKDLGGGYSGGGSSSDFLVVEGLPAEEEVREVLTNRMRKSYAN